MPRQGAGHIAAGSELGGADPVPTCIMFQVKSCNSFVQFSPLLIGHPAGRQVFFSAGQVISIPTLAARVPRRPRIFRARLRRHVSLYLGEGRGAELHSTPGLAPWASLGALRRGMCALGVRVRRRWIGKHETTRLWRVLRGGAAMSMGGTMAPHWAGGPGAGSVGVAGHGSVRLGGAGEGIGRYHHYRILALGFQGEVLGGW